MPFKQIDGIRFFFFESFDLPSITHGIATRNSGGSSAPWASLNVGGTVGDSPDIVDKNLTKIFKALALEPTSKYDVWQIHSADIQIVEKQRGSVPPVRADIILTNRSHITLLMRFADCVPIFLYDPVLKVIALVHAGRMGLLKRAPVKAVEALVETYGVDPKNVIAGIGPSICPDCYEVGQEVYQEFVDTIAQEETLHYFHQRAGTYHLDLWSCAQSQLHNAGVHEIEVSEICTATNLQDWYSHRGEKGRTGRFAALISLNG